MPYLFKRLLNGIAVLLGIVTLVFFLFRVLPGSNAESKLGETGDEMQINKMRQEQHLDASTFMQFCFYLNDLSPLSVYSLNQADVALYWDKAKFSKAFVIAKLGSGKVLLIKAPYLRTSYQNNRKVSEVLFSTLPETALLALFAIIIAASVGICAGTICALNPDQWFDRICVFLSVKAMALPTFLVGILIAWLFGYLLSDYTGLNMTGSLFTQDDYGNGEFLDLKNSILPAFSLAFRPMAVIAQLTRTSILEVLSKDFVRTAKAKGLQRFTIIIKHVLRNAINPILVALSGWIAALFAGSVFVETIFGWKGMGKEVVTALEKYDMPVVMGAVLIFALLFLLLQLIVDLVLLRLDPKVRIA